MTRQEIQEMLTLLPAGNRDWVSEDVDTLLRDKMIRQFNRGIAEALDALYALDEAEGHDHSLACTPGCRKVAA